MTTKKTSRRPWLAKSNGAAIALYGAYFAAPSPDEGDPIRRLLSEESR